MAREKRREELYVTVPNLFRCPISMDVMKSPVSLCTGVTYDRSSIEKWLALGHKTCPATMQTLPSTLTTPNLTLRRLIQLWLSHADAARAPLTPSSAVSKEEAAGIIKGELDASSVEKLIDFMKASEGNLKFVALSNGAVSRFVEFFAESDEIRIRELIVEVFDLISSEIGVREKLNELILKCGDRSDCLSSFATVLREGNAESKVKSAKILELIALNPESQHKISNKPGVLQNLYTLTTAESDTAAVEGGLSALLAVATSRAAKKELIRLGIVRTVGRILSLSGVVGVIERAVAMLETVATCTEGRGAIGEDSECVGEIVKRLMRCSGAATEHGITVLWSVCCLARDQAAQERVAKVNGLTKVLVVMQSACSSTTKHMCSELVKVLRAKSSKSNLAPYETRTIHIAPY
ncbi:U-box domain-containing protein 28-like [Salvia miltiorrhiza]|uniref:U-box domain-containing protein 28-like n=1 Tax=Salvia miltiorrhiza TaxID=226208 RepID=UPI0025AD2241|nr:U-box domain-containing protein 28-like [Salvia miltiorrhiza]